jgi:hypothetical protein
MDLFSNLDPTVKILSLGISGFCFLLVIMSFKLISDEQKKDNPRSVILRAIYVFMLVNFLNVIVVGFLGLPAISQNIKLKEENLDGKQKLEVKDNELKVIQNANDFDLIIDTANPSSLSDKQIKKAENYVQSLDSLAGSYSTAGSPKADSINDFKAIISKQIKKLKSDTTSFATKKVALEQINITNHKLTNVVRGKEKIY